MDLPTCPSCGQSVLDDDAADCPFCGAGMDGSSKGKKPQPAKPAGQAKKAPQPSKPASKPSAAGPGKSSGDADDDPFGLKQNTASRKVIPCAPKPTKSRTRRVRCPMCETQGFVPRSAVGKQVKCANPECMVPIFTVPDPDASTAGRAPARVSEEALAREEQLAKPAGQKNPLVMYGIIGGVLLALTLGFVAFLNSGTDVDPNLNKPVDFSQLQFDDSGTDDTSETGLQASQNQSPENAAARPATEAKRLTEDMVSAARQSANNRDKPFCRMLTSDAYLRLGMPEEAATEFNQLQQNSRDATYYRIEPYVRQYWTAIAAGNAAAATNYLADARAEADKIPDRGRLGLQVGIALTAALVNAGDTESATSRIESQQRDRTVTAQLDDMRQGAWFSAAYALRNVGFESLPPVGVFSWNEPLKAAVSVQLAVNGRWQQVTAWAAAQKDAQTASDVLAVAARHAVEVNASPETAQMLYTAAAKIDPLIGLRTAAILGVSDRNQTLWDQATAQFRSLETNPIAKLPDLAGIVRMDPPDLSGIRLEALAIADVAASAAAKNDASLAAAAIEKLYALVTSQIPPTAAVRQAVNTMVTNERSVMDQLKERFGLRNDSDVKTQFRNYRRNLDRLSADAEVRRLLLIERLDHVVRSGGAPALQEAMNANDQRLLKELAVDPLSMALAATAVLSGQQLPALGKPDKSHAVDAAGRIELLPERQIMPAVLFSAAAMQNGNYSAGVQAMEAGRGLPGFRACLMNRMFERAASQTTQVESLLDAIQSAANPLWREDGLHVAARLLTERNQQKAVEAWLTNQRLSATERVVTLHGIVSALAARQDPPAPAGG